MSVGQDSSSNQVFKVPRLRPSAQPAAAMSTSKPAAFSLMQQGGAEAFPSSTRRLPGEKSDIAASASSTADQNRQGQGQGQGQVGGKGGTEGAEIRGGLLSGYESDDSLSEHRYSTL